VGGGEEGGGWQEPGVESQPARLTISTPQSKNNEKTSCSSTSTMSRMPDLNSSSETRSSPSWSTAFRDQCWSKRLD